MPPSAFPRPPLLLGLLACAGGAPPAPAVLPASADSAEARLAASTRHAEWIRIPAGGSDSARAWVVYPERSTRAPVVVVIHERIGLTPWVRGVADQVAAEGFIAVAPELGSAGAAVDGLALRRVEAAGRYGTRLPAAVERWGVVGFGWGGALARALATHGRTVGAAVVFYGGTENEAKPAGLRVPTLALLADDASAHRTLAGSDVSGRSLVAARDAWARALGWLRRHLGR